MKKLLASLGLGLAFVGSADASALSFIVKNNTSQEITVQSGNSETATKSLKSELKVAPGQQEKFYMDSYRDGVNLKPTQDSSSIIINDSKVSFQIKAVTGSDSASVFKQVDFSAQDYQREDMKAARGGAGYRTLYYSVGDKQFDTYCTFAGTQYNTCWFGTPGTITYDYQNVNGKTKLFVYEDIYNEATRSREFKWRDEYFIEDLKGETIPQINQSGLSPWGK